MRPQPWLALAVSTTLLACATPSAPAAPGSNTAAIAAEATRSGTTTISGRLLGHDGQPMKLAHVHVNGQFVAAGPDGRFTLATPARGFTRIHFTGVDHEGHTAAALLDGTELRLDVRLGTYERPATFEHGVKVINTANAPSPKSAQALEPQADGTYAAELDATPGTFAYELAGIVSDGAIVNGTQADAYEYDGGGDYESVLRVQGPKVRIVFDPRKLPPAGVKAQVAFADPARARAYEIAHGITERRQLFQEAVFSAMKKGTDWRKAQEDFMASHPWAAELEAQLAGTTDPALRQLLLVAYFDLPQGGANEALRRTLAREAIATIPPEASIWSLGQLAVMSAAGSAQDEAGARAYLDAVQERNPELAPRLLLSRLASASSAGRLDDARRYFELLTTRFPKAPETSAAARYNPNNQVRKGQPMPPFELTGLDGRRYTPADFKGKTYLISFWATWCKPCVAELDTLHDLYRRYHGQGFEILAASFWDKEDEVKQFRAENAARWPMPWGNAFVDTAHTEPVQKLFGVPSLPTNILVGPDGVILATNVDVEREGLEKLVPSVMEARPAAAQRSRP